MKEGRIVRIDRGLWTVEIDGADVPCTVRPQLFENLGDEKNPVAVGDRVRVTIEGVRGTIEERLPRRNRFARPLQNDPSCVNVTAANVDQLAIVVAAKDPPFREGLIDRYLVAAERNDMDGLVVVNKCDIVEREEIEARLAPYRAMSYGVVLTSAKDGTGVAALEAQLADKTSLLVGHSGVGKSSLLNAIAPSLKLRTGLVAKHGRGRHTTTAVSLWRLPHGGYVVDSPGIRAFGLFGIPKGELAVLMPDLRPHAVDCHYPDCTHDHEPDCSVRKAVERGAILPSRFDSYLRMLHSLDGGGLDDDEE